ncbi:MAG TPA: ATP-binding protein, partial [Chthonomonadaceae bacterium]|nr:ATP-binding protein [Chthonomonadaceae bacterium]
EEEHIHSGPIDLSEIIDFVFRLVEGQAEVDDVRLRKQVERKVPPAFGNPRRLEHLFVNLLLNALNAVGPTGGTITVCIQRDADWVRVDVRDTGPGIPLEHQPHLFEPFFTTRANRTGLGLFSARRIVEAHLGEIKVVSAPGEGACVSVWLPTAEAPPELVESAPSTVLNEKR